MIWVYIGAIVLAVVLLAVAFYMIGVGHGQSGKVKFVSPREARQMRERHRNESLVNAVGQGERLAQPEGQGQSTDRSRAGVHEGQQTGCVESPRTR